MKTETNNAVKHTAGPWKQVGGTEVWEERRVYRICNCGGSYGPPPNVMRANARLISAAPDLLEACKAALDGLYSYRDLGGNCSAMSEKKKLEEAITKATGETI